MAHPLLQESRAVFAQRSISDQAEHLRYYLTDRLTNPASLSPEDNAEFNGRLNIYSRRRNSLPGIELKQLTVEAQEIVNALDSDGQIY